MVVYPDKTPDRPKAEENIIAGNVAFYGATAAPPTSGGMAGERFCVRNSGVNAVVEGVGDHGCEYMTGGGRRILGPTGRNFAAGMSGGIAYVLDEEGDFASRCNTELVALERLNDSDAVVVKSMIKKHAECTGSLRATMMLDNWQKFLNQFVKVMPMDYKRVLEALDRAKAAGLSGDDALAAAFEENSHSGH